MNFFEFDISYFRFYENIFLGIFHGVLFSFPLSTPILISFRYKLASLEPASPTQGQSSETGLAGVGSLQSIGQPSLALSRSSLRSLSNGLMGIIARPEFMALVGTILGQLAFLVCLCLGCRPILQIWSTLEPFLLLLGASLILNRSTDLFPKHHFANLSQGHSIFRNKSEAKGSTLLQSPLQWRWPSAGLFGASPKANSDQLSSDGFPLAAEGGRLDSNQPKAYQDAPQHGLRPVWPLRGVAGGDQPTRFSIFKFTFGGSLKAILASFRALLSFSLRPFVAITSLVAWPLANAAGQNKIKTDRYATQHGLRPGAAYFFNIFYFQVLLAFLNPIASAIPTRIFLSQDLIELFNFSYSLSFFITSFICISLFFQSPSFLYAVTESITRTLITITLFISSLPDRWSRVIEIQRPVDSNTKGETQQIAFSDASQPLATNGRRWRIAVLSSPKATSAQSSLTPAKTTPKKTPLLPSFKSVIQSIDSLVVFFIVGCVIQGSLQYNWRLFINYPLEFIGSFPSLLFGYHPVGLSRTAAIGDEPSLTSANRTSAMEVSNGRAWPITSIESAAFSGEWPAASGDEWPRPTPANTAEHPGNQPMQQSDSDQRSIESGTLFSDSAGTGMLLREFPSFDSNIRHRDKNLPVERHLPIERMNARRSLSGKIPFNEEQKSDAYIKYASFFLNSIEKSVENFKFFLQDRIAVCSAVLAESHSILVTRVSQKDGFRYAPQHGLRPTPAFSGRATRALAVGHRYFVTEYTELAVLKKIKDEYNLMSTGPLLQLWGPRALAFGHSSPVAFGDSPKEPAKKTPMLHSNEPTLKRILLLSKNEENITKGKPKNSYIRTLFDDRRVGLQNNNSPAFSGRATPEVALGPVWPWQEYRYSWNTSFSRFVHDDLYLYCSFLDESGATNLSEGDTPAF